MTAKPDSRWGVGLATTVIAFVVVMLAVTGYLMMQDVNLVTDGYYEKELRYQQRIRAIERARALGDAARIERSGDGILLHFPRTASPLRVSGILTLYRPSDRTADRTAPLAPDSLLQQYVPTTSLAPGLWRCQVQWTMNGEEYYIEQPFMVR